MIDRTLLYQCSKHDTVSYLFGTIHIMDEDIMAIADAVIPYVKKCDAFAMELDMTDGAAISAKMFELNRQLNWSYRLEFTGKKYDKVRNIIFKSFGIDISSIDSVPPMHLIQFLQAQVLAKDDTRSLDEYLKMKASSFDIEAFYLESIEEQLNTYKALVEGTNHRRAFKQFVSKVSSSRKNIESLLKAYKKMNIKALYQSTKKSVGKHKGLLIYKRNKIMANRFDELATSSSLFAGVGAAHLPGKHGMLRILKRKGYRIKPVRFE